MAGDSRDRRVLVAIATRRAHRALVELAELQQLCGREIPSLRVVNGDCVSDVTIEAIAEALDLDARQLERAVIRG